MLALSGHIRSELREALHTRVKRVLVVVASHYEIDLERVSGGYILQRAMTLPRRRLEDLRMSSRG